MLERSELIKALNSDRVLTPEEEIDCFYYIREKNDKDLKDMFIMKNQGLVKKKIMGPYASSREEMEDLFQEGMIGIMTAVDRFELEQGTKFSTYALWWIKHALLRYKQNHSRTIRLPVHMQESCHAVSKAIKKLGKYGIQPTEENLSEETGIPVDKVKDCMMYLNTLTTASLNSMVGPAGEEKNELMDFIPDEKEANEYESIERKIDVERYIKQLKKSISDGKFKDGKLTEREWEVICLRYGIGRDAGMTLEEVGERLGVSRERIRQIEGSALRKIKRYAKTYLKDYDPDTQKEDLYRYGYYRVR